MITTVISLEEWLENPGNHQIASNCDLNAQIEGEEDRLAILSILSPKEREIAILLEEGYNQQEIAEKLHKCPDTISKYTESLKEKIKIHISNQNMV